MVSITNYAEKIGGKTFYEFYAKNKNAAMRKAWQFAKKNGLDRTTAMHYDYYSPFANENRTAILFNYK